MYLREDELEDFEEIYRKVNDFATERHKGQVRKATGEDYINHPKSVQKIIDAYGGDRDLIHIAVLHDTLEDTETTWDEIAELFNERVADAVSELTNDKKKIEKLGKEPYMSGHLIELSDDALTVKLADMLHNVLDRPKEGQKERMFRNISYLLENRELTEIQQDLADAFISEYDRSKG